VLETVGNREAARRAFDLLRHGGTLSTVGVHDFSPVFSHRLPLASGAEAYRMFAARASGCTKVLLAP